MGNAGLDVEGRTDLAVYARSRRYVAFGQYEGIWLRGPDVPGTVTVGDFMGAPSGAAISADEEWLISVGNGFVAYRLRPPWVNFGERAIALGSVGESRLGPGGEQWWAAGRGTTDEVTPDGAVLWLAKVAALTGHQFLLTTTCNRRRPDGDYRVRELILDAERRTLEMQREWVEAAAKRRDHILCGLDGWVLQRVEARDEEAVLNLTGPEGEAAVILRGDVRVERVDGTGNQGSALAGRLGVLAGSQITVSATDDAGGLGISLRRPGGETRWPAWIGVSGSAGAGAWEVRTPDGDVVGPGAVGFPSEKPGSQGRAL